MAHTDVNGLAKQQFLRLCLVDTNVSHLCIPCEYGGKAPAPRSSSAKQKMRTTRSYCVHV